MGVWVGDGERMEMSRWDVIIAALGRLNTLGKGAKPLMRRDKMSALCHRELNHLRMGRSAMEDKRRQVDPVVDRTAGCCQGQSSIRTKVSMS